MVQKYNLEVKKFWTKKNKKRSVRVDHFFVKAKISKEHNLFIVNGQPFLSPTFGDKPWVQCTEIPEFETVSTCCQPI